jgi:cobalt-zinc-cadmium resistance protein CzcA
VQRPVFYSIGIIITAYLPIFTLQRVEGRLFKPMAWTVVRAAGLAAVLHADRAGAFQLPLRQARSRVAQPGDGLDHAGISPGAGHLAIRLRWAPWRWRRGAWPFSLTYLTTSGVIGSEFLPHLDEGAIWARATLAPSTGPTEGIARHANQARVMLASFPRSPGGQPGGTARRRNRHHRLLQHRILRRSQTQGAVAAGFPPEQRGTDRRHGPGTVERSRALWNFSQPIADNMEEAVSGVKGQLAIKIYGDDLKVLEAKGDEIVNVMRTVPGHRRTSACSA